MPLHDGEKRRLQKAISERVYQLTKQKHLHGQLFRDLYSTLKVRYGVPSYKDIDSKYLQDALRFISQWKGGAIR